MSAVRRAAFAGRFYPGDSRDCEREVDAMLDAPAVDGACAGIVPHAGWVFSGPTAGKTIAAMRAFEPETVVVFGAVHVRDWNHASLADFDGWETPIGLVESDCELVSATSGASDVAVCREAHLHEHSIEVELPLLQRACPNARLLAVMVRPGSWAAGIGAAVRVAAESLGRRVAYLASTDLTHYGPSFGFEPEGRGAVGIRWAKEVNDRRFIAAASMLDLEDVLREAELHRSACGAGAVAAMIGALRADAGLRYVELEHTTSAESSHAGPDPLDSVGYEASVFAP